MSEKKDGKAVVVYASAEETRAAGKPADHPKWRLFHVTNPEGVEVFIWAYSASLALWAVTKPLGWKVGSPDASAAWLETMLDNMSDEDRAALLAKYVPATKSSGQDGPSKQVKVR
jgi:hypothetical protein